MTPREVRVVPHDPTWGEAFEAEAAALRSVPGLAARPTIDVLIEVQEIAKVDAFDGAMIEKGYEAWGENGIPGRRFFTKDRGSQRTCDIRVFGTDHPETASAYGSLKKDLARTFPTDIESYMEGRDAFIKGTAKVALTWTCAKPQAADKLKARAAGPKRAESGGEAGAC